MFVSEQQPSSQRSAAIRMADDMLRICITNTPCCLSIYTRDVFAYCPFYQQFTLHPLLSIGILAGSTTPSFRFLSISSQHTLQHLLACHLNSQIENYHLIRTQDLSAGSVASQYVYDHCKMSSMVSIDR